MNVRDEMSSFETTTGDVNEEFTRLTHITMTACAKADSETLEFFVDRPLIQDIL